MAGASSGLAACALGLGRSLPRPLCFLPLATQYYLATESVSIGWENGKPADVAVCWAGYEACARGAAHGKCSGKQFIAREGNRARE